jgi:hypothetical protein
LSQELLRVDNSIIGVSVILLETLVRRCLLSSLVDLPTCSQQRLVVNQNRASAIDAVMDDDELIAAIASGDGDDTAWWRSRSTAPAPAWLMTAEKGGRPWDDSRGA